MKAVHDIRKSKVSEAVRKLNPHLFGVGQFRPEIRKQKAERALDSQSSGRKAGKQAVDGSVDAGSGMVRKNGPHYRVSFVTYTGRMLDSDNYIFGMKPLRDAVARRLHLDDADRFIEWEYSQVKTSGKKGTAVRIEKI